MTKQITIKNQESYELTLHIAGASDFYITAIDRFGYSVIDKETGDIKRIKILMLPNLETEIQQFLSSENNNLETKHSLVVTIIENKFSELAVNKSRAGINLEFSNGEPVVILGLGLMGGGILGRAAGVGLGALLMIGSTAVVIGTGGIAAAPIAAVAAAVGTTPAVVATVATTVVAGGMSGAGQRVLGHALTANDKDYTVSECLKTGAKGFVTGAVMNVANEFFVNNGCEFIEHLVDEKIPTGVLKFMSYGVNEKISKEILKFMGRNGIDMVVRGAVDFAEAITDSCFEQNMDAIKEKLSLDYLKKLAIATYAQGAAQALVEMGENRIKKRISIPKKPEADFSHDKSGVEIKKWIIDNAKYAGYFFAKNKLKDKIENELTSWASFWKTPNVDLQSISSGDMMGVRLQPG